ncbi:MAG: tetratricopeptide (TPR) repeat protein [Myxococcota bacterium]|jgi:tetratricopeptide (TPR) repeat protein
MAEYALRRGQTETAVVAALRVAAGAATVAPAVAVRALLVATQTRASAGRLAEVERDLSRAEDILRRHPDAMLAVQTQSWRAELALRMQDLGLARDLSLQTLKDANTFGYVRGRAFNAARLGQILRAAGRRREAEHYLRDALDAFDVTGDIALHAEVRLILATLVAERGDAVAARYLLDEALRRVRQLHIQRLIPVGLRVALVVASQVGDANDASIALDSLQASGIDDNEAPAAIARWWRTRGDLQRAKDVPAPAQHGYGHMLWRIEGARVALAGGELDRTIQLATRIRDDAQKGGFGEIALYATLILGGAGDIDDSWEERQSRATESLNIDVYLGAIEMEARRRHLAGDARGARAAWRSLALRSADLSYAPGLEEAEGWL